VRVYPALRITYFDSPTQDQLEHLLTVLHDFRPTALDELPRGFVAFFSEAAERDRALEHFSSLELVDAVAEEVPDENWAERSQAALTPVTVQRLTVAPPWTITDELRAHAPGPIVVIRPSMGFGTGHHASTRLCLALVQDLDLSGASVLDIGTGSGVLAIAAKVLGAARVVGIDVDGDAIDNARENAEMNGLNGSIELRQADLDDETRDPAATFDVVLANLTGGLLEHAAGAISSAAALPGALVISGYQRHEAGRVLDALGRFGWELDAEREDSGWVGARLRRASRGDATSPTPSRAR
jgi:ribosomal protein L11 methyltransferase